MDSFRLWQIAQSDLPEFLHRLHARLLAPRRAARPLAFWHRTLNGSLHDDHDDDRTSAPGRRNGTAASDGKLKKAALVARDDLSTVDKVALLQKMGGLANVSPFSLNALASCSTMRAMKPGELLFKEGELIVEVALLVEGQCQLTKRLKNGGAGTVQIACLGGGELCTESIVSGLDISRPNLQSLRHEQTAMIASPSILITVAMDSFRSGLKYDVLKQLKAHVDMKRSVRGLRNESAMDQRVISKRIRSGTVNQISDQSLTPLTSRLPDVYRTSTFAFLSPRRCREPSVVECCRELEGRTRPVVCREPFRRRAAPGSARSEDKASAFDQALPNKLVERWIAAPDEVDEIESTPKEFRLMKSKGVFYHI